MSVQPLHAQQTYDIDAEIARLRKELSQVQVERERNRADMERDRRDSEEYRKRTAERMKRMAAEIDSLKRESAAGSRRSDSLAMLIAGVEAQKQQIDLSQENLRAALIRACEGLSASLAGRLPPLVSREAFASISLLKSELGGRTIDNIEGYTRLAQIMSHAEEYTGSIQVVQESSPVQEIRGTVSRLRIGSLCEAVVDSKGEACAYWMGTDREGNPLWSPVRKDAEAARVFSAVNIREGKALPAFVMLPVGIQAKGGDR